MKAEDLIHAVKLKWIKEFGSLSHELDTVDGYFIVGFMNDVLKELPGDDTLPEGLPVSDWRENMKNPGFQSKD